MLNINIIHFTIYIYQLPKDSNISEWELETGRKNSEMFGRNFRITIQKISINLKALNVRANCFRLLSSSFEIR